MIVKGNVAQLHLTAGIVYILDSYAMIRFGHVHFGTARQADDDPILVAHANLIAANLDALVDVIIFVFECAALCARR